MGTLLNCKRVFWFVSAILLRRNTDKERGLLMSESELHVDDTETERSIAGGSIVDNVASCWRRHSTQQAPIRPLSVSMAQLLCRRRCATTAATPNRPANHFNYELARCHLSRSKLDFQYRWQRRRRLVFDRVRWGGLLFEGGPSGRRFPVLGRLGGEWGGMTTRRHESWGCQVPVISSVDVADASGRISPSSDRLECNDRQIDRLVQWLFHFMLRLQRKALLPQRGRAMLSVRQ